VIQPAISATTDSGPPATTERSRSRGNDARRLNNRRNKYTRPISASRVPIPTIVWNENRTTFTGG
jgi:hypothetical protein